MSYSYSISTASVTDESLFSTDTAQPRLDGIVPPDQWSDITSGDFKFTFAGTEDGLTEIRIFDSKFKIETGTAGLAFKLFEKDVNGDGYQDYFLGIYDSSEQVCPDPLVFGFKVLVAPETAKPECDRAAFAEEILKLHAPVYAFDPCAEPTPPSPWQYPPLTPEQIKKQNEMRVYSYPYVPR